MSEHDNEEQSGHQPPWASKEFDETEVPQAPTDPTPPAEQPSVWGAPPPPMQTGQPRGPGQPGSGDAGATPPAQGYGYGGGGGSSSSASKYRAPASARPARRLNMGIFAGMGLLILLLGIAIMAIMASRVLDSVDDATTATTPVLDDEERLLRETQQGLFGDETSERVGTAEVCQLDESTLRVAATAYNVTFGEWPSSVQEVIDSGFLEEVGDEGYELSVGPDDDLVIKTPERCD